MSIKFGGLEVPVVDEARYAFEFFSSRSPEMVEEMSSFMEYAKGKRCFLDIGALYGVFSMVFSVLNPSGVTHAFEPHPGSFQILKKNSELVQNVAPSMVALSDKSGEISMHQEWGIHYVAADGQNAFNSSLVNECSAKCVTGDHLSLSPDIIKIDVEGHELKVLRGLSRTISELHPVLLLELHPTRVVAEDDSIPNISDLLFGWGYRAFSTLTKQPMTFDDVNAAKNEFRIILL